MTLETAVLLLLCAAAGIAACGILLRGEKHCEPSLLRCCLYWRLHRRLTSP